MNPTDLYNDLKIENETPGEDGNPTENENSEDTENPGEDENSEDTENPTEDETPEDTENPTEDENPEEGENPGEDENPEDAADPMQEILDGIRESLGEKDQNVDSLVESVRSLIDVMSTDALSFSVDDLPFNGWRGWEYPVRMEYSVYPWGAGHWMDAADRLESPDALLARYNELLGLCQSGGTLKDFYVRYIWDDLDSDGWEKIVFDYEANEEPAITELPFDGWRDWEYPVRMEYSVYPWGAGYWMDHTETFDTPDALLARYNEILDLCQDGGTLKDFYVRYIVENPGSDERIVFDYEAVAPAPEEPAEDLTPAVLEVLQSIDSRLEIMGADLSTVSENSMADYDDMRIMQEQNNVLQFHLLVTSIGLGFTVFLLLGYIIAHGFWQRMRVG